MSSVALIHSVVVKYFFFSLSIQQQGRLGNAVRQTLKARIVFSYFFLDKKNPSIEHSQVNVCSQ